MFVNVPFTKIYLILLCLFRKAPIVHSNLLSNKSNINKDV